MEFRVKYKMSKFSNKKTYCFEETHVFFRFVVNYLSGFNELMIY